MMESPRSEQEYIITNVRNLLRLEKLKKETNDTTIKGINNLFSPEKGIKDAILRGIRHLFENEEGKNYYKPFRVNDFRSNNYIEY